MKAVTLPARLDTAAADQLWSELFGETDEDIVLDGAMVEVFGARCLEVILTARQLCEGTGRSIARARPPGAPFD